MRGSFPIFDPAPDEISDTTTTASQLSIDATTMASAQQLETNGRWTTAEHERFLQAMARYPRGPWRAITEFIGTRSIKQVQTHAQKYQQKLLRHQRGLHKRKVKAIFPEHRIDSSTASQFTGGCIVRKTHRPNFCPVSSLSISCSQSASQATPFKTLLSSSVHGFQVDCIAPLAMSTTNEMGPPNSTTNPSLVRHVAPVTFTAHTDNSLRLNTQPHAPSAPVLNELEASMLLEALQTTPL